MRLHAIPAVQVDVDLTPPAWAFPRLGETDAFVRIVRELFPELLTYTIGRDLIEVRLQGCHEVAPANIAKRAWAAQWRLYGTAEQLRRERLVDSGELDAMRAQRFPEAKCPPLVRDMLDTDKVPGAHAEIVFEGRP